MTFISYAQNFEDVMLWRALKDVSNGFYIDIGANDPDVDSVTRAFYDRGWSGINVEPVEQYYKALVEKRPRDLSVLAAIGAKPGHVDFFEFENTGLSTTQKEVAEAHHSSGREFATSSVEVMTLAAIWDKYVSGDVHFLKIDVEGGEEAVLRGSDFRHHRPWIIVVEATKPLDGLLVAEAWHDLVVSAGYRKVYFDGINEYFLAIEHEALAAAFEVPPNYFDHFRLSRGHHLSYPVADLEKEVGLARDEVREAVAALSEMRAKAESANERVESLNRFLEAERDQHTAQIAQLDGRLCALWTECEALKRHNADLQARFDAISNSTAWRLTAPLRRGADLVRIAIGKDAAAWKRYVKRLARPAVVAIARKIVPLAKKMPGVRAAAFHVRSRYPGFWSAMAGRLISLSSQTSQRASSTSYRYDFFSARSRSAILKQINGDTPEGIFVSMRATKVDIGELVAKVNREITAINKNPATERRETHGE
ncbi:FkbM family methyltransferase [Cupriavidus oxalaticus]|uniref:FkbM family methyltransferase n=1 Tax=Cupriavidus oxalaticus TaxID=96344 RepID=A0A4P7LD83_9BURK|nr:FkbM family methyltransferase [Cupriavidus oxalaticus]QBY54024.1 FkbM family methyltransferase [Cupriavidus oxalaticus]